MPDSVAGIHGTRQKLFCFFSLAHFKMTWYNHFARWAACPLSPMELDGEGSMVVRVATPEEFSMVDDYDPSDWSSVDNMSSKEDPYDNTRRDFEKPKDKSKTKAEEVAPLPAAPKPEQRSAITFGIDITKTGAEA